jgi:hypothetical protein
MPRVFRIRPEIAPRAKEIEWSHEETNKMPFDLMLPKMIVGLVDDFHNVEGTIRFHPYILRLFGRTDEKVLL